MPLRSFILALIVAFAAFAGQPTKAISESYVGSNIDSRVLVGLKDNDEGVQAFMPEGWTSIAFPGGPLCAR